MQEVQKNDLPQGLLGKIDRIYAFVGKVFPHCFIAHHDIVEGVLQIVEKDMVFFEEFFCDLFYTEGFFELIQGGLAVIILQEFQKAGLGGMAGFVLPDEKGKAARRGEFRPGRYIAGFGLVKSVFHLYQGKTPVFRMVCIKGNKCRLFKNTTATAVQIPGNEIPLPRAGLNQGRFSFKMDGKNIDLIAFSIGVFTDALKGVDIGFVGIGDIVAPIGEGG